MNVLIMYDPKWWRVCVQCAATTLWDTCDRCGGRGCVSW